MPILSEVPVELGPRSYVISIGTGLLPEIASRIPGGVRGRACFIVTDSHVRSYAERIISTLIEAGARRAECLTIEAGEASKSFATFEQLTESLLAAGIDRSALILAVGGGVVGDLAGFAAATVLRGVEFVQVPTTLLSQVDSSVGGKTGINTTHGKNLLGAFYQPRAVLCDLDVLRTLPDREVLAGYAEVVKYGLLGDAAFFSWLDDNLPAILNRDDAALAHAIAQSCRMKAEIVGQDERETAGGNRALLNLGHTFGHAFESYAGYNGSLLHGEGVCLGMVLAFRLSERRGDCAAGASEIVEAHLRRAGLPTDWKRHPALKGATPDILLASMYHDKKTTAGTLTFVLARGIGNAFVAHNVPESDVRAVLEK